MSVLLKTWVSDIAAVPQHLLYVEGLQDWHKGSCKISRKLLWFSILLLNLEQNQVIWDIMWTPKTKIVLLASYCIRIFIKLCHEFVLSKCIQLEEDPGWDGWRMCMMIFAKWKWKDGEGWWRIEKNGGSLFRRPKLTMSCSAAGKEGREEVYSVN
jgi:hypothetical protein